MTEVLEQVQDYVVEARRLLQDEYVGTGGDGYRYPDEDLLAGLNLAMSRARQLRADLFLGTNGAVTYYANVDATQVVMDIQYRHAVLMFMVGHAQLRDEEETQDARAAALMNNFTLQMKGEL
jgi:hypothetical protein